MKKYIAFVCVAMLATYTLKAANEAKNDTVVRFNNKIVQLADSVGQMKVKVFSKDSIPYQKVYEGIFSDGKSYEKWTVVEELGLDIPFLNKMIHHKKKKEYSMSAHWAGIGWGFANIADMNFKINDINGVSLKSQSSNEFYINLTERIIPIYKNNIGVTTGFGMGWHNYFLGANTHLVDNGSATMVVPAPTGITYETSRLRTFQLTVPLLLEWQPTFQRDHKCYLSAGVIGCVNTFSSYRVEYNDTNNDKINKVEGKGLNVMPVSVDFMAQAGYGDIGIFAKYSPFSIFESGKGPDVRAVSVGATLNF